MKFIKVVLRFFQWSLIFLIALLAFYILNNNLNLLQSYQSFVVQSGSMEPAIMTGDIIVVQPQDEYLINEVITFTSSNQRIVTHRIMKIEEGENAIRYATKGDANRAGDEDLVDKEKVIGKVILTLPRLGFLVSFSKSPSGLLVMIMIPAIILILDQLLKVINVSKES